jgi:hypothetical protein
MPQLSHRIGLQRRPGVFTRLPLMRYPSARFLAGASQFARPADRCLLIKSLSLQQLTERSPLARGVPLTEAERDVTNHG